MDQLSNNYGTWIGLNNTFIQKTISEMSAKFQGQTSGTICRCIQPTRETYFCATVLLARKVTRGVVLRYAKGVTSWPIPSTVTYAKSIDEVACVMSCYVISIDAVVRAVWNEIILVTLHTERRQSSSGT